jgi:beta-glucosidase-like glycosyl hydrolase
VSETYGEDPYLVTAMSVAYTRGLQGKDLTKGVLATAKHFVGYAVTEGGQNMAATAVGARELYDVYARPFEAAFRLAGLATVMPSYSEFDGVPISASRAILTDMLRGRIGFTGTTVSDYVAVGFLHTRQKAAATPEEAGSLALAAGMDVETPAVYGYGQVLAKAVREGKVPESLLDRSVRRVLRDKFALGLFDNPYVSDDAITIQTVAREGVDLSRRLAAESVTLLKNENSVLLLRRDIAKIAIIGPHADDVEAGFTTYTYPSALKMFHARATGGDIAMAGVDLGGGAPPEGKAAVAAELAPVFKADRREYIKSNYSTMSLAEAVRQLLPKAEVTAVSGTGVVPKEPTFLRQSLPRGMPRSSSSPAAADQHGRTSALKEKAPTPRTRIFPAAGGADQRPDRARQTDHRRHLDGRSVRARVRDRQAAGGPHRLLRRPAPGNRARRSHLRRHQSRRETAIHGAAARGAGADPLRPEMGQRLPTNQGGHPQGLYRHAIHAALRVRPWP